MESEAKGNTRVYFAGDFKFEVSAEKLMEAFEEQSLADVYKAKFGNEGLKRLREVSKKTKAGKLTYRQAASILGITYYEFVSLLEETGAA